MSNTLICWRVTDCEPHAHSEVKACDSCEAAVWRAYSSPVTDRIVCNRCMADDLDEAKKRGDTIEFSQPTDEQVRDFKRNRRA